MSTHPFTTTLRQGVCAESIKSSLKVFVLNLTSSLEFICVICT